MIFIFAILGLFGVSALAVFSSIANAPGELLQVPGCHAQDVPERLAMWMCVISFSPSSMRNEFDQMLCSPDMTERTKATDKLVKKRSVIER